jgi:hypothetical protein
MIHSKLEDLMGKYYDGIKDQLQIQKAFESSETEEESSVAIKALRPENATKFKEFLHHDHQKRQ